jgi:hypothetical protein
MRKEYFLFGILFLIIFSVQNVESRVSYFQNKLFINNETINGYTTIRNSAFFGYDKTNYDYVQDYVKKGNPLEVFVDYRAYLKTWNKNAQNMSITYCNMTIFFLPKDSGNTKILFNRLFYPNETDTDYSSNKYFAQLQDGEAIRTQVDCIFAEIQNLNPIYDFDIPVDFSYNTPTFACKSCQLYNWAKQQITINRATTLDDYTTNTISFTKRLFQINYEIITILFWIFTFVMFYIAITLLFTGAYWGYLYIKKWTNSI